MRNFNTQTSPEYRPEQEPRAAEYVQGGEQGLPPTPQERLAALVGQLPKSEQAFARSIMDGLPEREERIIAEAKWNAQNNIRYANIPKSEYDISWEKSSIIGQIAPYPIVSQANETAEARLQSRFSVGDPWTRQNIKYSVGVASRAIIDAEAEGVQRKLRPYQEPERKIPSGELPADIEPGVDEAARQAIHDAMDEPLAVLEQLVKRPVIGSMGRMALRAAGGQASARAFQSKQDRTQAIGSALFEVRSSIYKNRIADSAVEQFIAQQGLLPRLSIPEQNEFRELLVAGSKAKLEKLLADAIEHVVAGQYQAEKPKDEPHSRHQKGARQPNIRIRPVAADFNPKVVKEVEDQIQAMKLEGKTDKQIRNKLARKYHQDLVGDNDQIRYVSRRFEQRNQKK